MHCDWQTIVFFMFLGVLAVAVLIGFYAAAVFWTREQAHTVIDRLNDDKIDGPFQRLRNRISQLDVDSDEIHQRVCALESLAKALTVEA